MNFGANISDLALIFMVAVAVGGLVVALFFPALSSSVTDRRIDQISTGKKEIKSNSFRSRFQEDQKDVRRRQIADSLKAI